MRPAGGHEVDGFDGAQRHHVFVTAGVADDADGFDREEDGEGLAGFVVEAGVEELLDEDVVGEAEGVGVFLFDFAEDAHAQAGAGEGVAVDHVIRQAEFEADLAHFVLEEFAQGLDELELHVFGEAAHVVVGFDDVGAAGFGCGGFDHVGVNRALGEPVGVGELGGFGVEDVDEGVADDLAFLFRVFHAGEAGEEVVLGVDADDADAHVVGEHFHDLVAFAVAEETVVDEDAGELVADGFVQQRGSDGGVDAAGEAEDDVVGADLFLDGGDGVVDDLGRGPEGVAGADVADEAFEDAAALEGVGDFRVELDAVEAFFVVGHAGDGAAVGGGGDDEAVGHFADAVAVAHPDVQVFGAGFFVVDDAVEQLAAVGFGDAGVAEFVFFTGDDGAAQLLGHGLHAVADAQHGHALFEGRLGGARGLGGGDGFRAAGEDDAFGVELGDVLGGGVEGADLAVDADFAHAAGDQLGVLGAEVEDQDALGVDVLHGLNSAGRRTLDAGRRLSKRWTPDAGGWTL
ncbi:cytosine deaminase [Alcanivorax xiamenensis]|uniref:Cytosine deaminase n=1 Tax=Alcanivorax xiamenensis TaxID=1177156 RepID=A0ABQ6Y8Q8_9GAMM|nr:cytosine deaminase [Alcanivorax xiamenensis]